MIGEYEFNEEYMSPDYNPFEKPKCKDNHAHIKALVLVQADIVSSFLSDRERHVVELCICKDIKKKEVAKMLGVNSSTISRELKRGLFKLRKIIKLCDKAITYYERNSEK